MKVADSSYLIEGILRNATLFEREILVSPDLTMYEVVNALWKHETLIRDLKDAKEHIGLLTDLVSNASVRLIRPDRVKHGLAIYDSISVALALQLKMELATFDDKQSVVLRKERQIG